MAVYLSDICAIILIWNLLAWCFELSYCGCVLSCGYSCWGQFLLTPCLHRHPETARLTGYPLYLYPIPVRCTCTLLHVLPLFPPPPPTSTYPSPLASHTVLYLSASTFCLQYFLVPPPPPPSHTHTTHALPCCLFTIVFKKNLNFFSPPSFTHPLSLLSFLAALPFSLSFPFLLFPFLAASSHTYQLSFFFHSYFWLLCSTFPLSPHFSLS